MFMGMGMPIPDLSNLPGASRPGGGGTPVPPGPTPLAQVNNVYSMEFDSLSSQYIDLGNVTDLNNLTAFFYVILDKPTGRPFNCACCFIWRYFFN